MRAAPLRFANAALWPFTIWMSLTHLEEHAADDYVERTSPIAAVAVGFWLCAIGLAALWYMINPGSFATVHADGADYAVRIVRRWPQAMYGVLSVFTPALYLIGLWLFAAREEKYHG